MEITPPAIRTNEHQSRLQDQVPHTHEKQPLINATGQSQLNETNLALYQLQGSSRQAEKSPSFPASHTTITRTNHHPLQNLQLESQAKASTVAREPAGDPCSHIDFHYCCYYY